MTVGGMGFIPERLLMMMMMMDTVKKMAHRMERSSEPDTTVLPSAPRATQRTGSVWPRRTDLHVPEPRSQTLHAGRHAWHAGG